MSRFDLLAEVQAARRDDAQDGSGRLETRLAARQDHLRLRGAIELSAELAAAVARLPVSANAALVGRHLEVLGLATAERATARQSTAVLAVLDSETGVLSIAAIAAIHVGASSIDMLEAAMAEAIGAAFNWTDGAPQGLRTALGYPGADQHHPSILDVPDMAVSLWSPMGEATQDDMLQVAQISTVLALMDALSAAGCASPVPLPIAPDLVLRQLG